MFDAPLAQPASPHLEAAVHRLREAVGDGDIADQAAKHFRECVSLLDRYDPRVERRPLGVGVIDVRPHESDCDFLPAHDKSGLSRVFWRVVPSAGEHWTMIAGENSKEAAEILRVPDG